MTDLARIDLQIAGLEQTLADIERSKASMREAVDAAADALTASLREYASSPGDNTQERVEQAEQRHKDALKVRYTNQSAEKVIRTDLTTLRARREALAKEAEAVARAAAMDGLREELRIITEDVRPTLVRWAALRAICEGHPAGMANPQILLGRQERIEAAAVAESIKKGWRNG